MNAENGALRKRLGGIGDSRSDVRVRRLSLVGEGQGPAMAHGYGRVVRWDAHEGRGAVVVEGAAAEILVDAAAVEAPGGRALEVGELVEVEYQRATPGDPRLQAVRACPTDVGGDQG